MKGVLGKHLGQLGRPVLVLLVSASLMFPASNPVLCIAFGGHIAIENPNAECCASSEISTGMDCQSGNELDTASDCRNCTDILISANERGPIQKSYDFAAAAWFAEVSCRDRLGSIASSRLFLQIAFHNQDSTASTASTVPLRC
jgi:hypothetical protein